jgi:hypothetical protein
MGDLDGALRELLALHQVSDFLRDGSIAGTALDAEALRWQGRVR